MSSPQKEETDCCKRGMEVGSIFQNKMPKGCQIQCFYLLFFYVKRDQNSKQFEYLCFKFRNPIKIVHIGHEVLHQSLRK